MKRKLINVAALLAMLPATSAFAAALDRSGQPVTPLFQDGNLVELGYTWLSPSVKGTENGGLQRAIPNMAGNYGFPSAAIKYQANEKLSFAFLYDHPFGAEASYSGVNNFTTDAAGRAQAAVVPLAASLRARMAGQGMTPAQIQAALPRAIAQALGTPAGRAAVAKYSTLATGPDATNVSVTTQSFSLLAGYQPNKNWNIYGGPVYQTIKGDVHLRGAAYSVYNGYDASFDNSGAWGFMVGAAYQIPEIAFRAALTYRSSISHTVHAKENYVNYTAVGTSNDTKIKTPQSINLDLQSGIAPNTIAFANLRWVDWSSFKIQPGQFGAISREIGPAVGKPNGFNLVEYGKDQYSVNVGVGRKFNDQWAGNVSAGWDSGAGEYITTLGPTKGNWNLGIGAQYSPVKNFYISMGVKYFKLGNAKSQVASKVGTTNYDASFDGNKAVAVGMKVGYRF